MGSVHSYKNTQLLLTIVVSCFKSALGLTIRSIAVVQHSSEEPLMAKAMKVY